MTNVIYLRSPIADYSNYDLRVLAADICSTLNWQPEARSLVHLYSLGLDATNQQIVFHWLKCHQEDTEVPVIYRELCFLIYKQFKNKHESWMETVQADY